ncbi:unnamed protein product [Aphanomyces euteiches]
MKTISFAASALGFLALANGQTNQTNTSSTCSSLADPNNAVTEALSSLVSKKDVVKVAKILPQSWSSCIGSLDPDAIKSVVLKGFATQPTCLAAGQILLSWFNGVPANTSTKVDIPSSNFTDDDSDDYYNFTNAELVSWCTPISDSVLPCVTGGVLSPVFDQITANPCCSAMVSEIKAAVGTSPKDFTNKLLNYATNIVCNTQTPGFNGAANQTCGYSWVQSFINGDSSTLKSRILNALQVPNDQGCSAFQGNAFRTTKGVSVSNLFTKPIVPGSCVKPVDDLFGWVRQFPLLSNLTWDDVSIQALFADGKCVNGSAVNKAVLSSMNKDDAEDLYESLGVSSDDVAGACFHMSNGGYGKCTFAGELKDVVPQASTATTTAIPTTTPKSSIDLATVSLFVSTVAVVALTW